ncbi:MAG TPA: NADP-dependent oxidoreductase [Chloroflexia bacterium]|jgi:NADPH:quinone reductase-like Zn-dependent oxidoreductase
MKAVRINEWGQPAQVEDIPTPTANNDEVLVRVRAAGVNKVDWTVAEGYLQGMLTAPLTLGTDFAGEVVEVGADVTRFKPGDEVYGFVLPGQGGSFAEYVAVKESVVALKPKSLDFVEAAGVPLVGMTAWQLLFDVGQVQPGERVLIHGAGGGVGTFATQLAKNHGAYVIGIAGEDKAEHLRRLGIDEHHNGQFEEVVRDIDVVIDTVGGDTPQRSYDVLKDGGRLGTSATMLAPEEVQAQADSRGIRASGIWAMSNAEQLAQLAELVDAGKVKVFVDSTYPLEEVQAALDRVKGGHLTGKVVLVVS